MAGLGRNGDGPRLLPTPPLLLRFGPYAKGAAFGVIEFERFGLTNQVAKLSKAEGAWVKVRSKIGELIADCSKRYPAVLSVHLLEYPQEKRHGIRGRLKWRSLRTRVLHVCCGLRQKVLGVDEAATGLSKTFRRLLLAEPKNIDTLLSDSSSKSREVTVR